MPSASPPPEQRAPLAPGTVASPTSRAGRNLPVAIGVGLVLGGSVVATLLLWKPSFVALVTVATTAGVWELSRALRAGRIHVPVVPVLAGGLLLVPVAYSRGAEGLFTAFACVAAAVWVWRAAAGPLEGALRDIAGGVFALAYVPLLAGFAGLMAAQPDGRLRVLVFVILVVCSDTGGYAVGILAGRRPMAPSISPKKSWEGFGGSVAGSVVAGAVAVPVMLGGPWWAGLVVGVAVAGTATVGDLAESTLKRDLGIKDMGTLLPGHGGIMDRLDSMLVTAPVAWGLLALLAPA